MALRHLRRPSLRLEYPASVPLEVLFAFVVGVAVALLWHRGRSILAARRSQTPAPAVDAAAAAPTQRLQQLSEPLTSIAESSAHPRELLDNESFREAVAILESDRVSLKLVTDYAGGANWPLATAACAALIARPDRAEAVATIVAGFRHCRPWPMYYVLRYFETLDERPPVGALALQSSEWWIDHPFIPGLLGEHFVTRSEKGDEPSFGDALSRATALELSTTESLLRKIDNATSRQLLEALATFRRTALDREYLQSFGRFVEDDADRPLLVEHEAVRDLLVRGDVCILAQPPRSMLVVGEPRSGKTSFVTLLAMRAQANGWTLFEAGGAHLQAGQTYIGQLEERLRRLPIELASHKRVLWHAPDFLQLATSGMHQGQSASILDQVLPAIAAGRLVLLSEITPAALTKVLQQRPAVRTALELLRLRPLSDTETAHLVNEVAARMREHVDVTVESEALETVTYLARHYLSSGQMPGAVLDLLKLSMQRAVAQDATRVTRTDVLATMAQLTGMPQQVLDDRERVDLAELRRFFSTRVIGQDEAVDAVVDRVAMLKAGLTDSTKPVAVFLFAGPTGTGKTELAKTLAEFLFGSADRLIRLDMSEFQSVESMRKIVGDPDRHDEPNALTDRVRKQPFSVVLLDEFEKAHANAWDLFLQVFDDGRLTDAKGHTVDFRHCIIILTSNLGSTIRHDTGSGFVAHVAAALSPQIVTKAIHQSFRPEFVNRIDRIIVFRPLGREHMRSIVTKELSHVLQRRGLRHREWAVEWEASALEFLLDKGFSPTMGARPLKRAIDQHLLAPLAATLVEHRFPEGDQFLFVRSDGRSLQVEFVDPDAPAQMASRLDVEPVVAGDSELTLARMMLQPTGAPAERAALAAELQRLENRFTDDRWVAVESELATQMQRAGFWNQPNRVAVLSRFEVMDRVKAAAGTARGLAARLERSANRSGRYSRDLIVRLASQLFLVNHGIEDAMTDAAVEVALTVQPVLDSARNAEVSIRWCERLLEMYRKWAARRGMQVSESGESRLPVFVISGFGSARLLSSEAGLHVLDYEDSDDAGRTVARVTVRPTPLTLPESSAERTAVLSALLEKGPAPAAIVRRYRVDSSPVIRDMKQGWRTGRTELVFEGHFDVIAEVWPAAAEERRG
jgi:ATP-dependent Clp protease ATP-binding subunit ClpC